MDMLYTLTELNAQLATCSVTEAQLRALGFEPVDHKTLNPDHFTPEQWRKYRSARLYAQSLLPSIRMAIAKSQVDALKQ